MFLWSLIPLSITNIWNLGKIIDIKQSDFSVPWSNSISKLSSLLKNELKIHLIIWYNLSKTRSRRKWWHQYSFSGSELNNVWDYNFSRTSEKNVYQSLLYVIPYLIIVISDVMWFVCQQIFCTTKRDSRRFLLEIWYLFFDHMKRLLRPKLLFQSC